jgi:tetratricopeptide (TPR) repeat protein
MDNPYRNQEPDGEIETALLDAELFVKYKAPERAIVRLRSALERNPRSLQLRERLREVAAVKHPEEAARQCLALASLYIERDDFDLAQDRLLEAKHLDPRISIASGLEAIRRARRPHGQAAEAALPAYNARPSVTLAGDLSAISIFDIVQVIENSRLTGALSITNDAVAGRILFNEGRIVGAETGMTVGAEAFRRVVELTGGEFDFERAAQAFPVTLNTASNTNLILDSLREIDEENRE